MTMTAAEFDAERRARDTALHEAIGWLTGAIEAAHPGFLAEQADRAENSPYANDGFAAVLRDWANKSSRSKQ